MESFTAIGQVGQGFSTLFGFDNSELEQQIAKLVALQNVLQGIEKLRQQMNTSEGIGGWFSKGSKAVDQFVAKLSGAEIRMGKIIGSSKQASIALNGLSTVLKGVGGVAVSGGLMLLTTIIGNLVDKFKKWYTGGIEAGDATKILESSVKALDARTEELLNINTENYFYGITSSAKAAKNQLELLTGQITHLVLELQELNGMDFKKWSEFNTLAGVGAKDIEAARMRFLNLAETIETLEKKAEDSVFPDFISNLFSGLNGYKRDFKELGNAIVDDFLARARDAVQKAREETLRLGYVTKDTAEELRGLERELNKNGATKGIFDHIETFCDNSGLYITKIKQVEKAISNLNSGFSTIDPVKMRQLNIDAMEDSEEKIRKQNQLNRDREIAEVRFNPEYTKAINAKYDRELQENLKAYRKSKKQEVDQKKKEEMDVQREIDEYTIQLMREGLKKQIAELRNEEKYRRKEIEDSGIRVGERTNLLTEVYNKKELELRRDWAREVKEIYEKLGEDIEKIERDIFDSGLDTGETNLDTNTAKSKQTTGDNLITPINYDNIDALKAYYKKILEIEQQAADEEVQIAEKRLKKRIENDKEDEKRRHSGLTDSERGEYVKQLEQGKITQEQYDELMERENKAHTEKMKAIDAEYAADSTKIIQDSLDKKRSAYNTYYTSVIAEIRKNQDRISKESSSIDKRQDNAAFGFFNIKAVMKGYDELISKEKIAVEKIRTERDKLVQDKNNGKISGEDFLVRQEELDAAEEAAMGSIEDLEKKQKASLDKFIGAIMAAVQVVGQSIQQIFSAVWDAQDAQFEREQEELDKWNDELDKKLDKQEEIVQQHKDAIEDIEDELATARGSRRQHLIDQINAEIEAQREARAEEKRIQKEKEAAEKKQEALDKKRRKEEYDRNVMQAFISWHLGIANGLATQPFLPVGIAMGALATVLGGIQYALVKSQKPYARGGQLDGGVAQGKRHRDGGIKVLGGRAEIEGGEYITNRLTTSKNIDLLDYINSKKKKIDINDLMDFYSTSPRKTIKAVRTKFEDGGYLPTLPNALDVRDQLQNVVVNQDNRPIYVSVVDINNKQEDVRRVQTLAGL